VFRLIGLISLLLWQCVSCELYVVPVLCCQSVQWGLSKAQYPDNSRRESSWFRKSAADTSYVCVCLQALATAPQLLTMKTDAVKSR
jgi:hypothetical protein